MSEIRVCPAPQSFIARAVFPSPNRGSEDFAASKETAERPHLEFQKTSKILTNPSGDKNASQNHNLRTVYRNGSDAAWTTKVPQEQNNAHTDIEIRNPTIEVLNNFSNSNIAVGAKEPGPHRMGSPKDNLLPRWDYILPQTGNPAVERMALG